MRRFLLPIVVVIAFGMCIAIAGDFWKSKKFSTWNDEETKKVLEDSPWARQIPIKYIFTGGRGGGMGGGMPGGGMPGGGMGGGGGAGGGGFGPLQAPRPEMQTPKATLRWQSALPIKQAMARIRFKDEVEKSEEAAKSLSRQEGQYILSVSGVMGAPNSFSQDVLKTGATLKVGNLPPIPPIDVLIDRQGMSTVIFFAFPKAQAGAHIIEEKDKSMEFQLKTPNVELKGKFSLDDMVYQSKLEI